jgi:hypothetical protein
MSSRLPALSTTIAVSDDQPAPDDFDDFLEDSEIALRERESVARGSTQLPSVVIGNVCEIHENGDPLVRWSHEGDDVIYPARSIVPINRQQLGSEVALMFEHGQIERPIIFGVLSSNNAKSSASGTPIEATVDNEILELTAEREIVLRCGKASITLTRAGKVLIRGAYLLSRSSGTNRIKGGSVQIN